MRRPTLGGWIFATAMRLALACLLALASAAAPLAQRAAPEAADVLTEWREGWDRAARGTRAVAFRETLVREVDGPRGGAELRTEGALRYAWGEVPRRTVDRATLDGRSAPPPLRRRFERRTRRAYGPAADALRRPAPMPGPFLRGARPAGPAVGDRVDGREAWRVPLALPRGGGRVTAWFGREGGAPLLRLRVQRSAEHTLTADYRRVDGLDLPTTLLTEVTLRQRRRLRTYTVELRARGTYAAPEIVR